jgi:hypothetical protein
VFEFAVWWLATLGIWMLTLSSVHWPDLGFAMGGAIPCAASAVVTRRALGDRWRIHRPALGWLLRLPAAIVFDTVRVLAVPWKPLFGGRLEEGEFIEVPVGRGRAVGPTSARAAAILLVSATPGSYAVDDSAQTGRLRLHALVSGRMQMGDVMRR